MEAADASVGAISVAARAIPNPVACDRDLDISLPPPLWCHLKARCDSRHNLTQAGRPVKRWRGRAPAPSTWVGANPFEADATNLSDLSQPTRNSCKRSHWQSDGCRQGAGRA